MTAPPQPDINRVMTSLSLDAITSEDDPQVSSEEFFVDAGHGRTITWDTRRNREVMTRQHDSLAAQVHQASRNGLGPARSRKLRSWYEARAEQDDQGATKMLAYLDGLDADLKALALMSRSDVLADTEATTPSAPHSGAPPGGARAPRPHHIATVCAGRRTKEAGHVARLHTNTRTIAAQ